MGTSSTVNSGNGGNTLGNLISITSLQSSQLILTFTGPNISLTGGKDILLTLQSPSGIIVGQFYFITISYIGQVLSLSFNPAVTQTSTPKTPFVYSSSVFNNLLSSGTSLTVLYGYTQILASVFNFRIYNSYINFSTVLVKQNTGLMISSNIFPVGASNAQIEVGALFNGNKFTSILPVTGSTNLSVGSMPVESTINKTTRLLTIGTTTTSLLPVSDIIPANEIDLSNITLSSTTSSIGSLIDGTYYVTFSFVGTSTLESISKGVCPIIYSNVDSFPSHSKIQGKNPGGGTWTCAADFNGLIAHPGQAGNIVHLECYEYLCLGSAPALDPGGGPLTNQTRLLSNQEWANVWNQGIYTVNPSSQTPTTVQFNCSSIMQSIMHTTPNGATSTAISVQQTDGSFFTTNISTFKNDTHSYSQEGYANVNKDMNYVFSRYFNSLIPSGTNPGINNIALFQDANYEQQQSSIIDACVQVPGICDLPASNMCKNCTRLKLANNSDLLSLCGCQAPITDPLDPTIYGNIKPQCDPLCAMNKVSHNIDIKTGQEKQCTDAVCVMDNISVSSSRTQLNGISFTQVCPACEAQIGSQIGCKCIVDVTIPNIATAIGISGSNTFRQYCPNALCLLLNTTTQKLEPIPCDTYVVPPSVSPPSYSYPIPKGVWIIVGIILFLAILVLFSIIYASHNINVLIPHHWNPPQIQPAISNIYTPTILTSSQVY
jgi:hypothetical protein